MAGPVAALGFFAVCGAGGALTGTLLRLYWAARVSAPRPEGVAATALRPLDDWIDAVPVMLGVLLAAALFHRLVRAGAPRRSRRRFEEPATWLVLAAGALIWSHPYTRGLDLWGAVAVHTVMSRVALLASAAGLRVAASSDAREHGASRPPPRRWACSWPDAPASCSRSWRACASGARTRSTSSSLSAPP